MQRQVAVNDPQIQQENKYRCGLRRNKDVRQMTTEEPQPLDNQTTGLSGDNGGRDCERWKESKEKILLR
jgi:hypothetical protein